MLSGACVEREQIIECAYDRVSYNDLGVGLVASSCGGSRPEQVDLPYFFLHPGFSFVASLVHPEDFSEN